MKDSIKASLISAFVYPGVGHLFLKKNALGTILALIFSVPLYIVVNDRYTKVTQIIKQVVDSQVPVDIVVLLDSLNRVIYSVDSTELKNSLIAIIIIWLSTRGKSTV